MLIKQTVFLSTGLRPLMYIISYIRQLSSTLQRDKVQNEMFFKINKQITNEEIKQMAKK